MQNLERTPGKPYNTFSFQIGGATMRRSSLHIFASILFLVVSGFPLFAQAEFRTGSGEFPPYVYAGDDSGKIVGAAAEIVAEVFARLNITDYTMGTYPWARVLIMLTDGQINALFTITKNKEREALFLFPEEPIALSQWVFFIRKADANRLKFDSYDDLKGSQIGLVADVKYSAALWDYVRKEGNYDLVPTEELNILKLASKRVDYIVTELGTGTYLIKNNNLQDELMPLTKKPVDATPFYIAFSPKLVTKDFVHRFSNELKRFKSDKKYKEILEKYLAF
jgi:polar amino acid transport system substrate-binding protein